MPSWYSLPIIKTKAGIINNINRNSSSGSTNSATGFQIGDDLDISINSEQQIFLDLTGILSNDTAGEESRAFVSFFNTSNVELEAEVLDVTIECPPNCANISFCSRTTKIINYADTGLAGSSGTLRIKLFLATSTATTTNADGSVCLIATLVNGLIGQNI